MATTLRTRDHGRRDHRLHPTQITGNAHQAVRAKRLVEPTARMPEREESKSDCIGSSCDSRLHGEPWVTMKRERIANSEPRSMQPDNYRVGHAETVLWSGFRWGPTGFVIGGVKEHTII